MSDSKVYMVPDGTSSSSLDPNLLLSMMNNGGGFGGGNWIWVIFLFFLYGWRGNGLFGNGSDGASGGVERELLMQAIGGNRTALSELATSLNCDINAVQTAISNVQSSIQSVGNQVGLTGQQVINAIQQGNMSLASQLSQCCCDNKMLAMQNTAAITSRIDQLANGVTQGFSATAYETAQQTCALQNSVKDQTQTIMDKLASMEANQQQDKINTLTAQLTAATSRAERAAELKPILDELNTIKCAQPSTATVTYPNLVGVPLTQFMGYGYGYGNYGQGGFWG